MTVTRARVVDVLRDDDGLLAGGCDDHRGGGDAVEPARHAGANVERQAGASAPDHRRGSDAASTDLASSLRCQEPEPKESTAANAEGAGEARGLACTVAPMDADMEPREAG